MLPVQIVRFVRGNISLLRQNPCFTYSRSTISARSTAHIFDRRWYSYVKGLFVHSESGGFKSPPVSFPTVIVQNLTQTDNGKSPAPTLILRGSPGYTESRLQPCVADQVVSPQCQVKTIRAKSANICITLSDHSSLSTRIHSFSRSLIRTEARG